MVGKYLEAGEYLDVYCKVCGDTVLAFPKTYQAALAVLQDHYREVHPRRWRKRHRRADW